MSGVEALEGTDHYGCDAGSISGGKRASGRSTAAIGTSLIEIRKGQAPAHLGRAEFSVRFRAAFIDPAFRTEDPSIARLEEIAWQAYAEGRKAPFTQKAGAGYADPDYDLSIEWVATKRRIDEAQLRWADPLTPSRVLLICGSSRNDGTCPGEISKTFRLMQIARATIAGADINTDVLDLSLVTSEYGRNIHPVQGLRFDRDAVVPLAVQLLPQPRAQPDQ